MLVGLSFAWFGVLVCWRRWRTAAERRWGRSRTAARQILECLAEGRSPDPGRLAEARRTPGPLIEVLSTFRAPAEAAGNVANGLEVAGLGGVIRRTAQRSSGPSRLTAIDALGALAIPQTAQVLRRIWLTARSDERVAALQALEDIGIPMPMASVLQTLDHHDIPYSTRVTELLAALAEERPRQALQLASSPRLTADARAFLLEAIDAAHLTPRPHRKSAAWFPPAPDDGSIVQDSPRRSEVMSGQASV